MTIFSDDNVLSFHKHTTAGERLFLAHHTAHFIDGDLTAIVVISAYEIFEREQLRQRSN